MTHPNERLDRTRGFSGAHAEVAAYQDALRRAMSPGERLEASWVRTCRLYGIDPRDPPPMDRSAFSMRRQPR